MAVDGSGNIGIGDTDPTEGKLVVNGNIGFTGATATAARVNSGSYSGDNTANRAIAHGLGMTPKRVEILITGIEAEGELIHIQAAGRIGWTGTATQSPASWTVAAADSTNFYVGNSADYQHSGNSNTYTYSWVAFG